MKDYYPEGMISVSVENRKNLANVSSFIQAMQNGTIMEANVIMCDMSHNMTVDLGCMKGIIPRNEGAIGIAEGSTRDIALISRVGRPVCFIAEEIKNDASGNPYAILSRRKAQEICLKYIFDNLTAGDIIEVKITHLESFGAFCDIGCGNIALLPIDSISVSRISHPKDRLRV
ncbi:MAG: S1 RNA-binding domain-containing protein, partial [Clostridia bacterium]|nr:S1 RNA-binding domain-containing protein [Clostridia bacterium]